MESESPFKASDLGVVVGEAVAVEDLLLLVAVVEPLLVAVEAVVVVGPDDTLLGSLSDGQPLMLTLQTSVLAGKLTILKWR